MCMTHTGGVSDTAREEEGPATGSRTARGCVQTGVIMCFVIKRKKEKKKKKWLMLRAAEDAFKAGVIVLGIFDVSQIFGGRSQYFAHCAVVRPLAVCVCVCVCVSVCFRVCVCVCVCVCA